MSALDVPSGIRLAEAIARILGYKRPPARACSGDKKLTDFPWRALCSLFKDPDSDHVGAVSASSLAELLSANPLVEEAVNRARTQVERERSYKGSCR